MNNEGRTSGKEYGGVPFLPAFVRGLELELKIKIKDTACSGAIVS